MSKIKTVFKKPRSLFMKPLVMTSRLFSDTSDLYIKLMFLAKEGLWLNLKEPRSFNEKLNWMKNHYRNPLFTQMVDKYEVKSLVANIIGGGMLCLVMECGINSRTLTLKSFQMNLY